MSLLFDTVQFFNIPYRGASGAQAAKNKKNNSLTESLDTSTRSGSCGLQVQLNSLGEGNTNTQRANEPNEICFSYAGT